MLFNSPEFIVLFLPVVLAVFYVLRLVDLDVACAFLIIASLGFYAWEEAWWMWILIGSVGINFSFGRYLTVTPSRRVLILGIALNLLVLSYFKYLNFAVDNFVQVFPIDFHIAKILLPIGISFFTFQQIAFLVDSNRGKVQGYSFTHYALFVTFFPQLIAGPIVHHSHVVRQLQKANACRFVPSNIVIGFSIFVLGLAKKLLIADNMEIFASPVFDAANANHTITFIEAWGGLLAYTFQIYFDFSGYSDMAIGLARMFGLKLPANFNSPYKATSVIEFWKRWHITLSLFLQNYLYIPLGGNRRGSIRQYVNLLIVMSLGGLWHGASWTFVAWGCLHGVCLVINHVWRRLCPFDPSNPALRVVGGGLTFFSVTIAWSFFRADSFGAAWNIIEGLFGTNGFVVDDLLYRSISEHAEWATMLGFTYIPDLHLQFAGVLEVKWLAAVAVIVWFFPNTQEIFRNCQPTLFFKTPPANGAARYVCWNGSVAWIFAIVLLFNLMFPSTFGTSPFLYFQF